MSVGDFFSLQLSALSVACICLTSLVTLSGLEPKSVPVFISTNWLLRKYIGHCKARKRAEKRRGLKNQKRKRIEGEKIWGSIGLMLFSCSLSPFNLTSSSPSVFPPFSMVTEANPPFIYIYIRVVALHIYLRTSNTFNGLSH